MAAKGQTTDARALLQTLELLIRTAAKGAGPGLHILGRSPKIPFAAAAPIGARSRRQPPRTGARSRRQNLR
jgi:hypothetical protein